MMEQPQKPRNFQFINLTQSATLDKEDLTTVRMHAMRDFSNKSVQGKASVREIEEAVLNNAAPGNETTQEIIRFKLGPAGWTKERRKAIYKPLETDVRPLSKKHSRSRIDGVANKNGEEKSPSVGSDASTRTASHVLDLFTNENSLEISAQSKVCQNHQVATPKENTTRQSDTDKGREQTAYSRESFDALQITVEAEIQDLYQSNLSADLLDPFDTVPGPNTPHNYQLISHLNVMSVGLMKVCRNRWHALAIQDPALLRVALSHAAANLSMLQEKGGSTESLIWRTDAIRILNERLTNLKITGLSPYTIGAVASMASFEATNGALATVLAHINGLDEMIKMIGGIHNVSSPDLQRLILWSDLNCANALGSTPRFSAKNILPLECEVVLPQDLIVAKDLPVRVPVGLLVSTPEWEALDERALFDLTILHPALAIALLDLRYLTDSLKNIQDPKISKRMDELWYSDGVYSVQRRLMSLSASLPVSSVYPTDVIDRACILAALIYVEIGLRNVNPHARIIFNLVTTLHYTLAPQPSPTTIVTNLYFSNTITPLMNIMLWILIIGTLAAVDEAERVWFGSQLAQVKRILDIDSWVEASQVLTDIAWPDSFNELVIRSCIWENIEEVYY